MRTITCILLIAITRIAMAQDKPTSMDHSAWNLLLRKYVSTAGTVDYVGFKADPTFDRYLASLSRFAPQEAWSDDDKKAYWINACNAFTVKLVCDHLPLKSIEDIGEPWKKKFIRIGGEMMDLDHIEQDILRDGFKDPRIHFAISDASVSGPVLSNHAYTARILNAQLDEAARDFINDPARNSLRESELRLSSTFDRFKEDFVGSGTIAEFLQRFMDVKLKPGATVSYMQRNPALNGK